MTSASTIFFVNTRRRFFFSLIIIILFILLSASSSNIFVTAKPPCYNYPKLERNVTVSLPPWTALTSLDNAISPRSFVISLNVTFTPNTQLIAPITLTLPNTTQVGNADLKPLTHDINISQHYNSTTGVLNMTARIVVRTQMSQRWFFKPNNVFDTTPVTISFERACNGALRNISAHLTYQKQVQATGRSSTKVDFQASLTACKNQGYFLPTFVKSHEWNEWQTIAISFGTNRDLWTGNFIQDRRPLKSYLQWIHDPDYDAELDPVDDSLAAPNLGLPRPPYFGRYRYIASGTSECYTQWGTNCANDADAGGFDMDAKAAGLYNYSARIGQAFGWKLSDCAWQPVDPNNRDIYYVCAKLEDVDGGYDLLTSYRSWGTETQTLSPSLSDSESTSLSDSVSSSASPSASVNVSVPEEMTRSSTSSESLSISSSHSTSRSLSLSRSHSSSHSLSDASPSRTRSTCATQSEKDTATLTPPLPYQTPTPNQTLSHSRHHDESSSDTIPVQPPTPTPSHLATLTTEATLSRLVTLSNSVAATRDTATPSATKVIIPPPLPTRIEALPVAEEALVTVGTTIAAVAVAPAAAQAMRSLSVIAIIDTAERCSLAQIGKDEYASDRRYFPEALIPGISVAGPNETNDRTYGLPSRRGALIANTFLAPICLVAVLTIFGLIRRRLQKAWANASPLATGRVPGLTAAILGATAVDGIFCNATVLMTLPVGVEAGDVVLSIVCVLVISAIVIAPGVMLRREMNRCFAAKEEKRKGASAAAAAGVGGATENGDERSNSNNSESTEHSLTSAAAFATATAAKKEKKEKDKSNPLLTEHEYVECVPACIVTAQYPRGRPAGGFWWLCGFHETWTGPNLETIELYRSMFATNRGLHQAQADKMSGWKYWRRWLAVWSFYFDVLMLLLTSISRGWATARPCEAHNKVQYWQLTLALLSFAFACIVLNALAPLRRAADMLGSFLLSLGLFTLVILGSESAVMVRRTSLGAAFVSTVTAIFIFIIRRVVLPFAFKGNVVPRSSVHQNMAPPSIDIADIFAVLLDADSGTEMVALPQPQQLQPQLPYQPPMTLDLNDFNNNNNDPTIDIDLSDLITSTQGADADIEIDIDGALAEIASEQSMQQQPTQIGGDNKELVDLDPELAALVEGSWNET